MYRALVIAAVSAVAFALAGCESSSFSNGRPTRPTEEAQLAAFAASNHFPTDIQATDGRYGALVDRQSGAVRIVNFTDQPLRNARVWVNGTFVHPVNTIPSNGFVTLPRLGFYDTGGYTLSNQAASVSRVQIQQGDRLYNTMGPVFE